MGYANDNSLKEELETCKRFLVDSEIENGRHRIYKFAMDSLDPKYLLEKLVVVFDSLICSAKLNVAFGFVLENVEDGSCRYYYAQEKITLMERSKLVATAEDVTKMKIILNSIDVYESCTKKRANTKCKTSSRMLKFLQPYSKKLPWAAKTLFCQIHY